MNEARQFKTVVAGKEITLETGKLAMQAGGAVTVRWGDTMLLATATMSKAPREGIDFFPLSVDYEERLYAVGRIPGSFFRREGRPAEAAILICRLTDRPIRPLFPKDLRNDVQVILTALSHDQVHHIDILGIIGASAALTISDIPWDGPVGAVRIGLIDGELVVNPTIPEMVNSRLDLRVAGTREAILMVEAGANEVPEATVVEALKLAHEAIQPLIDLQEEMREAVGKPKREYTSFAVPKDLSERIADEIGDRLEQVMPELESRDKAERAAILDAIENEVMAAFDEDEIAPRDVSQVFTEVLKREVRERILNEGIRPDGRGLRDIRPISVEVGIAPRAHGSGLFTRGETQVLSIATLGTPRDEQPLDGLYPVESKRYIHHYNFPPYSTGETRFLTGPKRREIGHGALAETALRPMIPPEDEFPYTIRVVSEVLSSNGSTSMASVCGSTLALMDAGVPIKRPVAGIAMGLIKEGDRYAILTDIQGMEDHLGDMDFKVAGTTEGITALQMDIKIKGISYQIMAEALEQAREARLFILDKMLEVLPEPRPELSPHAPRMTILHVDPDKIGAIIGPGGKMVRHIQEETGARIEIEDDGTVYIAATNGDSARRAQEMIEALTEEPEIGKVYVGKVVRTTDFGAFVEFLPGQDGMVHISQLADFRASRVEDVVQVGDEIMVMVTDIDADGKVRLSRQAVLEGWTPEEARARDRKPSRGGGSRGKRGPRRR
ncbi:MAG: polyribonucleotide nucleotidyltransferase [Chloroflexi bacterium]|nr:MAG: polyribonucleotide nucleotidyltransferase [Chloroflexota bacterium]